MDIALTANAFLSALQLADTFFPTGLYAHSQGLEGMIGRGAVRRAEDVEAVLANQLVWSVVPADGVALLNAHAAAAAGDLGTVRAIDELLHALRLPAELRAAATQAGRRLLDETAPLLDAPFPPRYRSLVTAGHAPGTSAVALGVVAQGFAIPAEAALLAFCHSYVVGVLGAALRLLPLTHRDAQRIRYRLGAVIAEEARSAADRDWRDLSSFSPAIDVVAMLHETDDVRMFAS